MIKTILAILLLHSVVSSSAQYTIRIELVSLPAYHPSGADVYAAGSFNGWNPKEEQYKFKKDEAGKYYLDLKLDAGNYDFKITRGSWDNVECKKGGAAIDNHTLKVTGDGIKQIIIEEWQDRVPPKPKLSTASKNVHILDTAFLIPQLKRTRRIWVYLPENYQRSKKQYPVLYMHDGQNIFDEATAYAGEWGVDEFMDSLKTKQCIIIGIDNGGDKRMNEYCPYDFTLNPAQGKTNKGEGKQYVDFIVQSLKPYIDKHYRTLKDKANTFIAGSSMGGLISLYAVLTYPKVFGGAGVFSPSVWICKPELLQLIKTTGKKVSAKMYFYCGKAEAPYMVSDMLAAFEQLSKVSSSAMTSVIRDEGRHNEATWRKEFPLFYNWLMKR